MNKKILQKVIDSIKANKLEYAMGILDTLMDSLPELPKLNLSDKTPLSKMEIPKISDEGTQLNLEAKAKLNNIDMSAIHSQ